MNHNKKIVLQNGKEFYGTGFGADKDAVCELVFNTSMVGYQEIISDPTYLDQMVVMTYPIIGNYGITDEDFESKIPVIGGLIVRDYNDIPSNFRYTETLSQILEESNVPAISGLDTRMLTRIIRDEGSQVAVLTSADTPVSKAIEMIKNYKPTADAVKKVSGTKIWYSRTANPKYNIVAIDCGIKHSIIRTLKAYGCNITVVPYNTKADEILALRPDGLLVSNGPGNPSDATCVIDTVKVLKGKLPILGIGCNLNLHNSTFGRNCNSITTQLQSDSCITSIGTLVRVTRRCKQQSNCCQCTKYFLQTLHFSNSNKP